METEREWHARRAREERERAAGLADERRRALHEQLARLHDEAAKDT